MDKEKLTMNVTSVSINKKYTFEKVSRIKEDIKLPRRSTTGSAGYDFFAIEDVTIRPFKKDHRPVMVPTGVKVKIPNWTFLMLTNRSSNPGRLNLVIPHGQGIIDSDFYNNEDNEGEMAFSFYNVGDEPVHIKKGDKLGQGIIMPYYTVTNDDADGVRTGGYGSSGR